MTNYVHDTLIIINTIWANTTEYIILWINDAHTFTNIQAIQKTSLGVCAIALLLIN